MFVSQGKDSKIYIAICKLKFFTDMAWITDMSSIQIPDLSLVFGMFCYLETTSSLDWIIYNNWCHFMNSTILSKPGRNFYLNNRSKRVWKSDVSVIQTTGIQNHKISQFRFIIAWRLWNWLVPVQDWFLTCFAGV